MTADKAAIRANVLGRKKGNSIDLVTPEGVPLAITIALAGDRLVAFLLDFLIISVVTFFFGLLAAVSGIAELMALVLVVNFLLRNFYFMFFEQRWQGSTPGKRGRRLRVVDANGGLLSVEAIIVRNLTRDVEIFLPLVFMIAPEVLLPDAPAYLGLVAMLWVIVLGFMPLFNKQRRRIGDLIAGTIVIASPQVALLPDLAAKGSSAKKQDRPEFIFSDNHLKHYGAYELQVLEEFLRAPDVPGFDQQAATIRIKIRERIGWEDEVTSEVTFLKEFYAAQRAYLERRMLLGKRRVDKNADED